MWHLFLCEKFHVNLNVPVCIEVNTMGGLSCPGSFFSCLRLHHERCGMYFVVAAHTEHCEGSHMDLFVLLLFAMCGNCAMEGLTKTWFCSVSVCQVHYELGTNLFLFCSLCQLHYEESEADLFLCLCGNCTGRSDRSLCLLCVCVSVAIRRV